MLKHFITFLRFACQFFGFCLSNITVSNEKCKNICEKIKVEKEQEDEEAEQVAVD